MWTGREKPSEETLQGSWVELHFNTAESQGGASLPASQSQSSPASQSQTPPGLEPDLEKMLLDAQHESRSSSDRSSQCNSPLRSTTPPYLSRGSEGTSSQSEEDYQADGLTRKNADGIWHWPSRPENNPPREFQLKRPRHGSTLSLRNTSVMKRGGVLSPDFLKLFMPSLILSHILALGLGIYIGRRLTARSAY